MAQRIDCKEHGSLGAAGYGDIASIGPRARELHRRAVTKSHEKLAVTPAQDFDGLALKWMVAASDCYLLRRVAKSIRIV